jgi:hypothetical protein
MSERSDIALLAFLVGAVIGAGSVPGALAGLYHLWLWIMVLFMGICAYFIVGCLFLYDAREPRPRPPLPPPWHEEWKAPPMRFPWASALILLGLGVPLIALWLWVPR